MAIINYIEGDDPTKKNQFGVVTGVDLTAPVILNNNSLDIESINGKNPEEVSRKWNTFQVFLQGKNINTDINSIDGKEKISIPLINEFNTNKKTSFWAERGESITNPLTRDDIFAAQRFNQKADPNIQIDGWVGTQTIQLKYPRIEFLLAEFRKNGKIIIPKDYPQSPETLVPIIWGNKRFVIPITDFLKTAGKSTSNPFWKLYNPVKDKDLLPWNNIKRLRIMDTNNPFPEWDKLDNTVDIDNVVSINQQTLNLQNQKSQLQNITNLVKSTVK